MVQRSPRMKGEIGVSFGPWVLNTSKIVTPYKLLRSKIRLEQNFNTKITKFDQFNNYIFFQLNYGV